MAAAEQIVGPLTSITRAAAPLAAEMVQGSIQEFGITTGSMSFRNPVFFAPQQDFGEPNVYWGSLIGQPIRVRYTVATWAKCLPQYYSVDRVNSFEWERLSLELMRIASLESNWDGEGAESVQQNTVTTATILLSLARSAVEHLADSPSAAPTLFPTVEGGAAFKWVHGSKELKCTVLGDAVEVVRWTSPDRYESDGFWEIPVRRVGEHFEWLFQR